MARGRKSFEVLAKESGMTVEAYKAQQTEKPKVKRLSPAVRNAFSVLYRAENVLRELDADELVKINEIKTKFADKRTAAGGEIETVRKWTRDTATTFGLKSSEFDAAWSLFCTERETRGDKADENSGDVPGENESAE